MNPAKKLIDSVRNVEISFEELCQKSVELSELLLKRALTLQTRTEAQIEAEIARMMSDPAGKAFTVALTDQAFRSQAPSRIMERYRSLIAEYGLPRFLSKGKRVGLRVLNWVSYGWPKLSSKMLQYSLRRATERVLIRGEEPALTNHIRKRQSAGLRINLNHLGEAILGEKEAQKRLQTYMEDLQKPDVEYISVKISTLYSQINLLAREETLALLQERLKSLYRIGRQHPFVRGCGTKVDKFVNLDMEEYRDLHLTVDTFCGALSEDEFLNLSAGIVLQSYLPDSFAILQKLSAWAVERHLKGGAPIKIRVVKGANLAMEQVEAALRGFPQAPYSSKLETDANYKRMLIYASEVRPRGVVHIGVASHNLFDISFALLLRAREGVEPYFSFEMLEGMAEHIRRAVQEVSGDMLLYCPAVTQAEFQNGMGYLIRRLDENSAPENFLHCLFGLASSSREWLLQRDQFLDAAKLAAAGTLSDAPRRDQNRHLLNLAAGPMSFTNEPDTDWSLPHNVQWGHSILETWRSQEFDTIPLVCGEVRYTSLIASGEDPSVPGKPRYRYCLGGPAEISFALDLAVKTHGATPPMSVDKRCALLRAIAEKLRAARGSLIGCMVLDVGKSLAEADAEVSEAIDFAEYYSLNLALWHSHADIEWSPKGVILVASPWNFPCSIPAGGILAALATGNKVLFKPAPEAVLVGWTLVQLFWQAGVDKTALQFINCCDAPVGSQLIQDPRLAAVILTGATATAKLFLKMRPGLDLLAETGGKNSMIITAMSDRDLAIKDLLRSAFGYAGQKCSACSLAILEAEVYDSPHFKQQLLDAASSLQVGPAWSPAAYVTPLIRAPQDPLLRGLKQLEPGESWGLQPKEDAQNPQLWSPGIKFGVQAGSFTHQTELFGPVLGVMRASTLEHALELANGTKYGLTGGLHTLDSAEMELWSQSIEVGNAYINRTMTGAIVQRQPFGGCKDSSFGRGFKTGGPNYLVQLMCATQKERPEEKMALKGCLRELLQIVEMSPLSTADKALWLVSAESYTFYWESYFRQAHDPSSVLGQQNLLTYRPLPQLLFRMHPSESLIDLFRVLAAALVTGCPLEVSGWGEIVQQFARCCGGGAEWLALLKCVEEPGDDFIRRIVALEPGRIRMTASTAEHDKLVETGAKVALQPILANGRLELLNYLREISLSYDYHRYGNQYLQPGRNFKG